MIQFCLSNLFSHGNAGRIGARCLDKCALILFFIYNKHFQVNGNIDPVDEGGKQPQASENKIKLA
jgi:hypothetical protein